MTPYAGIRPRPVRVVPPCPNVVVEEGWHVALMDHEYFATDQVTVKCGDTLSMVNDSRWVHIIGAGSGGHLDSPPRGVPVAPRTLVETNDSYTTGKWNVPGEYSLTCSVHPAMTVKVVVTDCCC